MTIASALSARQFSWTPWAKEAPVPEQNSSSSDFVPETTAPAASTGPVANVEPIAPVDQSVSASTSASAPIAPAAAPASTTPSSSTAANATAADAVPAGTETAHIDTIVVPNDATLGQLLDANPNTPLEMILSLPEAVTAFASVADLRAIGNAHSWYSLSGWVADGMLKLHNLTGLPWWATIVAVTAMARLVIFRKVVDVQRHNVRMQAVQPQMSALMARAREEKDPQEQAVYSQALRNLMTEHNINPAKPLVIPLMQFPVFLSIFYALEWMSKTPFPQLKEGGFSWVTDLTVTDPYYILPITSMILTNLVVRVSRPVPGPIPNATTE